MAKTIFLFSAFAALQTLVRCRGNCADTNTCSVLVNDAHVSKSAALLQVSRKARKDDVSPARTNDEVFRQALPLQAQLGDLLTRVQSLEAIATPGSKEELSRSLAAYDRAMGDKVVDETSLDTGLGKTRVYGEASDKQGVATVVAPEPELDAVFTKAVEERVAERKVLADKAAFDAAVEKAVDEKLAAEGIVPVSSRDVRIGMPVEPAMQAILQEATTQQALHSQVQQDSEEIAQKKLERNAKVVVEREYDTLDRIDRSGEKLGQNIDVEEKVAKERNGNDWKESAKAKVEEEETARDKRVSSKEDKIDDDVTKWIGDDLSGDTSESETYQKQHKKSHSGHSVEGYDEQHGDSGDNAEDNHHAHHHSSNDRDHHHAESHHRHTHEGHSRDDDSENNFQREPSGKKHLYHEREEQDRLESDEQDRVDESWNAVAQKTKGKRKENERRFVAEPVREETKSKQHWNAAKKEKKNNHENGRRVIVDPTEKISEDFPYEMLMDVDFIVDATPDSDSIEESDEMTGHSNRGNSNWGKHAEKHGRKKKVPSKSEAHSKSAGETEISHRETDGFPSDQEVETPERDEAEEIIFDQQKFKPSERQKHAKKNRWSSQRESDEAYED